MTNKNEYDFLRELTIADDRRISRVAGKYPALDKSAIKRINALCEEKLKMKENEIINNPENSYRENVEVIGSIPWYRRPAFTAAACFVVLAGITGGIMALFSGKDTEPNIPDNPPLSVVTETTSETSSTETTTVTTSADTTNPTKSPLQTETTAVTSETTEIVTEEPTEAVPPADDISQEKDFEQKSYEIQMGTQIMLFAEELMSNSVDLDCDMDNNFTDESGQLYVKVTESGFNSISDVENYIRSYMTDNCINNRYSALVDKNSGKFMEKENGLYIRYAPKASPFSELNINSDFSYNPQENCYSLTGTYDNFGEICRIELIFRYENDVLKLDEIRF